MLLPVDVSAVADPHDQNDQRGIMYIVDHTVVANPQALSVIRTHELLATDRSWIRLQGFDCRHNPGNPFPVDPPEVFSCRPGKLNAIGGHPQSVVP